MEVGYSEDCPLRGVLAVVAVFPHGEGPQIVSKVDGARWLDHAEDCGVFGDGEW